MMAGKQIHKLASPFNVPMMYNANIKQLYVPTYVISFRKIRARHINLFSEKSNCRVVKPLLLLRFRKCTEIFETSQIIVMQS